MTYWRQVDVFLNGKLVSSSSTNYGYMSMLEMQLHYSKGVKDSRMRSLGFYKDSAGYMDDPRCKFGENIGLSYRYGLVEGGKPCHLYGPLMADICRLQKYLLSGVDVHIRLRPNSDAFSLTKEDTFTSDYKIKIIDLYYHVLKVTPRPEVVVAQNKALMNTPALYPYDRHRIQTYALSQNSYIMREDQVFQREIPQKIAITFVSSEAYNGKYSLNPFNFHHYNLNTLYIY